MTIIMIINSYKEWRTGRKLDKVIYILSWKNSCTIAVSLKMNEIRDLCTTGRAVLNMKDGRKGHGVTNLMWIRWFRLMWKLCTGMFSGKVGKWEIVTRGTTGVSKKIEGDKGPIVLWKNNFKEKADWPRNGMERLQEGIWRASPDTIVNTVGVFIESIGMEFGISVQH